MKAAELQEMTSKVSHAESRAKSVEAANNESSPPKKRYRYECRVDDCTNIVKKGGLCNRHGAKVERKRCRVADCTKYAQKGGLCIRHGAKVELKRCSVDDCTNIRVKGGVCKRHGAKVEYKLCSVDGCTNQRHRRGGVCTRHRTHSNIAAPPAQENFLCGDVQGGGNQNDVSTV
eukprot:scaffold24098_cov113-Skeletonema_marinoi.AAC.2